MGHKSKKVKKDKKNIVKKYYGIKPANTTFVNRNCCNVCLRNVDRNIPCCIIGNKGASNSQGRFDSSWW